MSTRTGLVDGQGRRFFAATAVVAAGLVLGAGPSVAAVGSPTPANARIAAGPAGSAPGNGDNVTFCHATNAASNPYVVITTDPASIIKVGHGDHTGPIFDPDGGQHQPNWGDIIPGFDYPEFGKTPAGHFDGLNLPEGQAWLDRSCALPPLVIVPMDPPPADEVPMDPPPADEVPMDPPAEDGSVGNDDNVTFCHATNASSNPYVVITTDPASIIQAGHGDHTGLIFDPNGGQHQPNWGDIIPEFDYRTIGNTPAGHFDGLNLPEGQSWLDRSCAATPAEVLPMDPPVDVLPMDPPGEMAPMNPLLIPSVVALVDPPAVAPMSVLADVLAAPSTTPQPRVVAGQQQVAAAPILAFTGAEVLPLGLSALMALALGTCLTVVGRRRARV